MAEGVVAHAATICAKPLGSVYEWFAFPLDLYYTPVCSFLLPK
jgi:hypothetical protein